MILKKKIYCRQKYLKRWSHNTFLLHHFYFFFLRKKRIFQKISPVFFRVYSSILIYCSFLFNYKLQKKLDFFSLKELHNAGATTSAITRAIDNVPNSKKKAIAKDVVNARALIRRALIVGENQEHLNSFIQQMEKLDYILQVLTIFYKMNRLPSELVVDIFKELTFTDAFNLASTS
jgi:hypothetical protein